ncbi:hypothetical protein VNO80_01569 [Phaseolus coccineus]|uniref:Uncharacterized protein n=1 Tax=Phaseolus coccineus TaxID=3886 RepID=A0AAN9RSZ9_PHACN
MRRTSTNHRISRRCCPSPAALDLVRDVQVHDDCIVSPPEENDEKVTARKLNHVFLIDEVEDHSHDAKEDLHSGLRRCGGGANNSGILGKEVLNKVLVINEGIKFGLRRGWAIEMEDIENFFD